MGVGFHGGTGLKTCLKGIYLNMPGFQQIDRMLKDDHFVENSIKKFQSNQRLW